MLATLSNLDTKKKWYLGIGAAVLIVIIVILIYMSYTQSFSSIVPYWSNQQTDIYYIADEVCSVFINGTLMHTGTGWSPVNHLSITTGVGDVITFKVTNAGGVGALRAIVVRAGYVYGTGDATVFKCSDGTAPVDISGTSWAGAIPIYDAGITNPATVVPDVYSQSKYVWHNNMCSACDVSFVCTIPEYSATDIYAQCDDSGIILVNDAPVASFVGWNLSYITIYTKVGDRLSFKIKNGGGAGMLRALVVRNGISFKTGDPAFTLRGGGTIIDATTNTTFIPASTLAVYNAGLNGVTAPPTGYATSKYVWPSTLCTTCEPVFDMIIPEDNLTQVQLCNPWKSVTCKRAGSSLTCAEFKACKAAAGGTSCIGSDIYGKCGAV